MPTGNSGFEQLEKRLVPNRDLRDTPGLKRLSDRLTVRYTLAAVFPLFTR
jgi:hypothetical protein